MYFYSPYSTLAHSLYQQPPVPIYYASPISYLQPLSYFQQPLIQALVVQNQKNLQLLSTFNSIQNQKQKSQSNRIHLRQPNDQFQVNQAIKTKKISNFRQKVGRNILSNIFRQFLRYFFYNKERSLELVAKIIKSRNFQINPKQFFSALTKKNSSLKTYVRVQQIKSFIEKKSDNGKADQFNQILRVLLMIHLKHNHTSAVYYSGKVPKESRQLHFTFGRKLQEMLKY